MKRLTPVKTIRAKCLDCMGNAPESARLVKECNGELWQGDRVERCPLHPFRLGTRPRGQHRTPVPAMAEKCRWGCSTASGKQPSEVADCSAVECSLWPYRCGRRPKETPVAS